MKMGRYGDIGKENLFVQNIELRKDICRYAKWLITRDIIPEHIGLSGNISMGVYLMDI